MATATTKKSAGRKGQMKLPDLSEFAQQPQAEDVGMPGIGKVDGLDYEKWAVAIVDLNDAEHRVERNRNRIAAKGYRKVEGNPLVGGFDACEVWVIPRKNYEKNRQKRRKKIDEAIANGTMTEFAIPREVVTKAR